ncbi:MULTISPECIES: hypothetical protein [Micromonosporaceae]|uniref:hypothetical protein n=1 Tax=Micromonosporaceae TaxID=28056 RepID=UPI00273A2CAF|nr:MULTISPECIES: hypothetical protein [Actinoplanes]
MPFKTILAEARTQLADRRAASRAHRQLCAELAAFQTPAERAELDLILSRHPETETHVVRDILVQQDAGRQRAWPLSS